MPTDAASVLDRMQLVLGVQSDGELARALSVARSTLGSWRAHGRVPYDICVALRGSHGVSLDWLLTGEGEMMRGQVGADTAPACAERGADQPQADWSRRMEALAALLGDLQPEHREAILTDALSRAATAQQLDELKQALADLRQDCRSGTA